MIEPLQEAFHLKTRWKLKDEVLLPCYVHQVKAAVVDAAADAAVVDESHVVVYVPDAADVLEVSDVVEELDLKEEQDVKMGC